LTRTFVTEEERAIAASCVSYEEAVAKGFTRTPASFSALRKTETSKQRVAAIQEEVLPDAVPLPNRNGVTMDAFYQATKAATALQALRNDRIRTVEVEVPGDNWVGVAFVGDVHIGGLIDYDLLERDLRLIEEVDGLYAVGMGDYGNFFHSTGKLAHAANHDTVPDSTDQLDLCAHVLSFNSKWLALGEGNHDGWAGSRGIERLAKDLNTEYFSQAGCAFKIKVGSQRYISYLKHTWRGHSNINTSNESRRFWAEFPEWENADFTVLAHFHQPDTHTVEKKGQSVGHLRGGTYKLVDDYAAKGGYEPAYGPSLVLLNPVDHVFLPFHGPQWTWGVEFLKMLRSST
jgi:hypothetical protein